MLTLRRRAAVLLVCLVAALGLAGCGRFTGTVSIDPEDMADVRLEASIPTSDPAAVQRFSERCAWKYAPVPELVRERDQVRCRVSGNLTQQKLSNIGISVGTVDGRQHFDVGGTRTGTGADGEDKEASDWLRQMAPGDFRMAVTFRGKVLSHSGTSTVSGRTVTWTNAAELTDGLRAEAEAPGPLDRSPGEWVAIAAGVLALLAFVGWVVRDVLSRERTPRQPPWGGPLFVRRRR